MSRHSSGDGRVLSATPGNRPDAPGLQRKAPRDRKTAPRRTASIRLAAPLVSPQQEEENDEPPSRMGTSGWSAAGLGRCRGFHLECTRRHGGDGAGDARPAAIDADHGETGRGKGPPYRPRVLIDPAICRRPSAGYPSSSAGYPSSSADRAAFHGLDLSRRLDRCHAGFASSRLGPGDVLAPDSCSSRSVYGLIRAGQSRAVCTSIRAGTSPAHDPVAAFTSRAAFKWRKR